MVTRRDPQGGFTMVELMVAMAVMLIGLIGTVQLSSSGVHATSFARSAGEAVTLAQDKMEALRTVAAPLAAGSEVIDALGVARTDGAYTRAWGATALPDGTLQIAVTVAWDDGDGEVHQIALRTVR